MVQKLKFTDASIRALKPGTGAYVFDTATPAFGVYVGKNRKTFIAVRAGRRQKLGVYGVIGLAEARDRAKKALFNDVAVHRRPSMSFADAVDKYLTLREAEMSVGTLKEYTRHLRKNFAFRGDVEDITQSQVLDALDRIPSQSERAHAARALKTFLNWCLQRDYVGANPMLSIKMPKEPASRERTLSDEELKAIWSAMQGWQDIRFAVIVRILMLTGQRANQIASLEKSWVDLDRMLFSFPKEVMKGGKAHTLPFGEHTARQLELIPAARQHYFSPPGESRPFRTWSGNKAALDEVLRLPHWTIHDLRRTWSTNAPRLGITPEITERILAHATPGGSKIAAIYNRYRFEDEMREAMLKMESFVADLVRT